MKAPILWLKIQYRYWMMFAKCRRLSADLRMDCLRMAMKFGFEIMRRESKEVVWVQNREEEKGAVYEICHR